MIKVKVCGVKTLEAAETASEEGAAFVGFIFFERSHRYILPASARSISRALDHSRVKTVGVFVDEPPDHINSIADLVELDCVQLHGHESVDSARSIERPIIKAWRVGDNFEPSVANEFPSEIVLLDSYVKGLVGGTGARFDWTSTARSVESLTKPLMIAGGISIDNVSTVIDVFKPRGIDVSGSLEVDGVKSVELIRNFLRAVRTLEEE